MKTTLTDRAVKAAKPQARAYDMHDAVVPGLLLEVRPSGLKRLALLKRYPGSKNPTRRLIGSYGAVTLEQARTTARRWLELLQAGIDPATEAERAKRAEARKQRHTFAHVVERYRAIEVIGPDPARPRQRGWRKIGNALDILVALFGERPVTDFEDDPEALMTPLELIAQIGTDHALVQLGVRKKLLRPGRASKPSPEQARSLFTFLHMVFTFAVDHGGFGLARNPDRPHPQATPARRCRCAATTRSMTKKLAALWIAAGRLRPPHRQVYRTLLLSGLRLNEVARAHASEFNGDVWTIPRNAHEGPTTERARAALRADQQGVARRARRTAAARRLRVLGQRRALAGCDRRQRGQGHARRRDAARVAHARQGARRGPRQGHVAAAGAITTSAA